MTSLHRTEKGTAMHSLRLLGMTALGVTLAACTSTAAKTGTGSVLRTTTPPPVVSASAPSPSLAGTAAQWQRFVQESGITTSDLTSGFASTPATEGGSQTQCPTLHAVADTRTTDVAYRRVSFELTKTFVTLDEVIAVTPQASEVLARFASTGTICAHFRSTASTGDEISYTVTPISAGSLGDDAAAVQVDGVAQEAAGPIHAGSTVIVFRKGPVLVQVSTNGIPPPDAGIATTVATIAARKLAEHPMP